MTITPRRVLAVTLAIAIPVALVAVVLVTVVLVVATLAVTGVARRRSWRVQFARKNASKDKAVMLGRGMNIKTVVDEDKIVRVRLPVQKRGRFGIRHSKESQIVQCSRS